MQRVYTAAELRDSPSRRAGLSEEAEREFRRTGAAFIRAVGVSLELQPATYSSGIVFFHHFFIQHSFKDFARWDMAAACLFVGGKVEEQPKKLRDLLPAVYHHQQRQRRAQQQEQAGEKNPDASLADDIDLGALDVKSPAFKELKERVLANERVLLQSLKFDLSVVHPFRPLLRCARALTFPAILEQQPPEIEKQERGLYNRMVQAAWNYVGDSYMITLCLEYRAETIAVAMLSVAARLLKRKLVRSDTRKAAAGEFWWSGLARDATPAKLQAISDRLTELYKLIDAKLLDADDSIPDPPPHRPLKPRPAKPAGDGGKGKERRRASRGSPQKPHRARDSTKPAGGGEHRRPTKRARADEDAVRSAVAEAALDAQL